MSFKVSVATSMHTKVAARSVVRHSILGLCGQTPRCCFFHTVGGFPKLPSYLPKINFTISHKFQLSHIIIIIIIIIRRRHATTQKSLFRIVPRRSASLQPLFTNNFTHLSAAMFGI
jgi:hypothetical protein